MRAGALRNRVQIQSLGSTYDDYGDLSNSWSEGDTVWASIFPVGGTEVDIAKEMVGVVTHVVKMRYRDLSRAAAGNWVQTHEAADMDDGDTFTLTDGNGVAHSLVAGTDFTIATGGTPTENDTDTAISLTTAINAIGGGDIVSASKDRTGFTWRIYLTQLIRGSGGNGAPTVTGDGWNINGDGWETRGTDGLSATNRLLYGGQILQVESVRNWQERNVFLELLCKEVTT